jgi:hypothetical protein
VHVLQFMATENDKYHSPAASHLTLYIEPVNGKCPLAIQDINDRDMPHGLTQARMGTGRSRSPFEKAP